MGAFQGNVVKSSLAWEATHSFTSRLRHWGWRNSLSYCSWYWLWV